MDFQVTELSKFINTTGGNGVHYLFYWNEKVKFNISHNKLPDFLSKYCEYAAEDEENGDDDNELCVAELIETNKMPLIVTFNLRFQCDEEDEPSLYDEPLLELICHCIQTVQLELLQISQNFQECVCVVLESNPWKVGEEWRINIKFQFPYCIIDQNFYNRSLKPNIIKKLRKEKVLKKLEETPIGDLESIISDVGDYLPLYRSRGIIDKSPPYSMTHIYPVITIQNIEEETKVVELPLKSVFQVSSHTWIHNRIISTDFLGINVDISHWLPLFLSCHFYPGITHVKETENETPTTNTNNEISDPSVTDKNPRSMLRFLLPLLNLDRAIKDPYWMDVGRALYNIYDGNDEGLKKWLEFSFRADRNEELSKIKWYSFRLENYITIKTIAQYAKNDNPEKYKEWHDSWCKKALVEATSKNHADVAEIAYRMFWLDFICVQSSKNGWYHFNGVNLVPQDDAMKLKKQITEVLVEKYKEKRHICSQNSKDTNLTQEERNKNEGYLDLFNNLIKALSNQGFKTSVIKFAQEKFYDEQFKVAKNFDPCKMAWQNCVTEICDGQIYKREGKLEDYITKNTRMPLYNFSWDHPLVKELMDWFGKVFVDKELLHYFKKIIASFLYGKNAEKIFQVWTGGSNGSKSIMVKFIHTILGQYSIDVPEEVFTTKPTGRSGPSPELAQFEGAHTGFISETDSDTPFGMGAVKKWTGGDRFFARMCNDDGGSINAILKMILMCNEPPKIKNADKAVHNRWLHVPFLSEFVFNPPESIEEQYKQRKFKMDLFFERKLPDLALAGAWVMFESFKDYHKEGLKAPKIAEEHTNQYWEDNDPILIYIQEHLENVRNDNGEIDVNYSLTASEMYPVFVTWFKQFYQGEKAMTLPVFKTNLCMGNHLGPHNANRWYGVRLRAQKTEKQ